MAIVPSCLLALPELHMSSDAALVCQHFLIMVLAVLPDGWVRVVATDPVSVVSMLKSELMAALLQSSSPTITGESL